MSGVRRLIHVVLDRTQDVDLHTSDHKRSWAAVAEAALAFQRVAATLGERAGAPHRMTIVSPTTTASVDARDGASPSEFLKRFSSAVAGVASAANATRATQLSAMNAAVASVAAAAAKEAAASALPVVLDLVVVVQHLAVQTDAIRATLVDALAAAGLRRVVCCQLTVLHAWGSEARPPGLPVAESPRLLADTVPLLVAAWQASAASLVGVMSAVAAERAGGAMLRIEVPTARATATVWCGASASLQLALERAQVGALSVCRAETSAAWRADTAVVVQSHLVALHVADAASTAALLERAADRADGLICLQSDDAGAVSHLLVRSPLGQYVLQALAPRRADWHGSDDDDDDDESSVEDTLKLVRVSALRELVRNARLRRPGSGAHAQPGVTGVAYVDAGRADASGVVPRAIERATRYLPLSDARTLLFNPQLHDDLRSLLAPLIEAARAAHVSEQSAEACGAALRRLHALCDQNDARFFLLLGDSARVRREAFVALWVELRTQLQLCASTPRHVALVQLMETLRPDLANKTQHEVSLPILAESLARTGLSVAQAVVPGSGAAGGGDAAPKSAARAAQAEREALASGKVRVKRVRRDADGKPLFPINAKGANVLALGVVVHDRSLFHNEKYIWPVGFRSARELPSLLDPARNKTTIYTSEIIDGGKSPMFRVTPLDAPNEAVVHSAPSGCWRVMLGRIKQRDDVSVSGPEMFGFSDTTIRMLIQELPNARLCTRYAWVDFEAALELQEVRRREHERLAHQLDDADEPAAAAAAVAVAAQSTPARARRAGDGGGGGDAHLWRQYEEARANAERDSLRAEYERQSQATARDFEAAPAAADITFAPSLLQSGGVASSSVLAQYFHAAAKRRRVTPSKAPFGSSN